ncbi:MAG TPA: hypothetical protein PLL06_20370, partial [Acidobacteriota bacterium]|nr:hypothetical protein [Acidobacteriota bacterium]
KATSKARPVRLCPDFAKVGFDIASGNRQPKARPGKIWAESDGPGLGSRFYVVLPLSQAGKEDSGTWQVSQLLSSRLRDRS